MVRARNRLVIDCKKLISFKKISFPIPPSQWSISLFTHSQYKHRQFNQKPWMWNTAKWSKHEQSADWKIKWANVLSPLCTLLMNTWVSLEEFLQSIKVGVIGRVSLSINIGVTINTENSVKSLKAVSKDLL